ncbi:ParB family protein [Citrobacter sp. wls619]|uniref:ParB family protein n=1 Tax=Citrobacter sp. wls619 TaxID=2576432 RepID=UPI00148551B7|nr:ParB family protein [Citrobacter sp. wls619]
MNNDQGTLLSVSLDQLRAFDLNPRITRNPDYEEIKDSIRNRGLDLPPQITQRPGEKNYIIASGGNTRLAILNELWLETHDKKYWTITCLYRKWSSDTLEKGNLQCLMGHLIENEMRGSLTFIERALGILKSAEMYSSVYGSLSQSELLNRLSLDGYPVHQSVFSKMTATVNLLLPHIPEPLYGGLSRNVIDKILTLRSSAEKFWDIHSRSQKNMPAFEDTFAMAILPFNVPLSCFSVEHIQDELTGLISQTLNIDYNTVALVTDASARKRESLLGLPAPVLPEVDAQRRRQPETSVSPDMAPPTEDLATSKKQPEANLSENVCAESEDLYGNSPENSTMDATDTTSGRQINDACVTTTAKSPSGLATDTIWNIDPAFDDLSSLASLAEQTAWELASAAGIEYLIQPSAESGFALEEPDTPLPNENRVYWQLLSFLTRKNESSAAVWQQLFLGTATAAGLTDDVIIRLFQLVRLIRRLHEKQREPVAS